MVDAIIYNRLNEIKNNSLFTLKVNKIHRHLKIYTFLVKWNQFKLIYKFLTKKFIS